MNDRRRNRRRIPKQNLPVLDLTTGKPIGELANLSSEGAMFITPKMIRTNTKIKCRLVLARPIMGKDEIKFKADCRWCRKNIKSGKWESGYKLEVTEVNKELISYLTLSFELGHWGDKSARSANIIELENRRKSERYEFEEDFPVFEHDNYRQIGELGDLSVKGIRLVTTKKFSKGDSINLKILLPQKVFQQEYLVFKAECMWNKQRKNSSDFESGYKIVSISEKDAVIILHLLIHYSKAPKSGQRTMVVY